MSVGIWSCLNLVSRELRALQEKGEAILSGPWEGAVLSRQTWVPVPSGCVASGLAPYPVWTEVPEAGGADSTQAALWDVAAARGRQLSPLSMEREF